MTETAPCLLVNDRVMTLFKAMSSAYAQRLNGLTKAAEPIACAGPVGLR